MGHKAGGLIVGHYLQDVARLRHFAEAEDLGRGARLDLAQTALLVVTQGLDPPRHVANHDGVVEVEGAVLDQYGSQRAALPVHARFDDGADRRSAWVGLQFGDLGD